MHGIWLNAFRHTRLTLTFILHSFFYVYNLYKLIKHEPYLLKQNVYKPHTPHPPTLSVASIFAPLSMSSFATSKLPFLAAQSRGFAAQWRGALPSCYGWME